MNTSHGWIKLYRCLLDDAVCQKSAYFHLWVTLLLLANHKEHEFIFNNEIHKVTPGQLITGRRKLAKMTGIHQSSVDRILKCLESAHMIEQKVLKKYRIITIVKWEFYQARTIDESTGEPIMSQSRTDGEPIVSTYKNDKNVKNEKNLSLREDFSFTDNLNNDPLLQETLRIAQEYDNEQKRICQMLQRTNP